ncbi:glycosyltransferase family 4 protein [Mucilaginibacter sp. 14171R-50]|uniref:glycosyltransferase family 4 protein n=1 Tax=Mucilaginibacter sp. 14171R-50 TaxID=2703789 RepID=UPI00138C1C00|nr:glycosyltransferase family 4 protein [Mucilaginibacter sp. 14171R-50]QHS56343.1 glycosyltransferase family 4 protein [Mucilaginibacter sp. 14171R-50]
MKKNILFVSNDAALMGAPMVLLHLVKWLKNNTDVNVYVLLKDGGPLQPGFENLGQTNVWQPGRLSSSVGRRFVSMLLKLSGKRGLFIPFPKRLKQQKFDLVYLNTADTMHMAPLLKNLYKCPVIAHIHELSYSINAYFPDAFNKVNTAVTDHYIAASKSVYDNMVNNIQVPAQKVSVLNEFIAIDEISRPALTPAEAKAELALNDEFVVGASGIAGWRKGTDIFLQLARLVNKKLPDGNIKFVWVGHQSKEARAQAVYETDKLGLKNKIIFTGRKAVPQNYYQLFNLFVLTSREDPFPLVCLEAAALQKPIFCFKGTGGIPEIVTPDTGQTFDYGDIDAMANAIIETYRQPEKAAQAGKNAADMVKKYDVNIIAPQIFTLISDVIAGSK